MGLIHKNAAKHNNFLNSSLFIACNLIFSCSDSVFYFIKKIKIFMSTLSQILIPIFLLIILGYVLKRQHFLEPQAWDGMEKLIYFICFPILLIHKLSTVDLTGGLQLSLTLITTILVMSLVLVLSARVWQSNLKAFTSVFQGSLRFNTYIGLAIVAAWSPNSGVALAAVAMLSMIPLLNILCVLVLKFYASHTPVCGRDISKTLLQNPLIIGCLVGISLNLLQLEIPMTLQHSFQLLGQATLPLGLLAVGAGLQLHHFRHSFVNIVISSSIKLLIFPIIVLTIHAIFQLECHIYQIALLFSALPTTPSAYILAKQMGGDAELMANIVSVQIILSLFTLPLILWLATC